MSDQPAPASSQPGNSPGVPALRFLKALGPAVIVASVVLGPGSILSSSKVGAAYGFSMVWVLFLAAGLMMGMVALGARLGVTLQGTMCDELAARLGRPLAFLIGLTIFLICAGFQFGNNLGVLAALEPWLEPAPEAAAAVDPAAEETVSAPSVLNWSNLTLLVLNAAIVAFLYGSRRLYKPVERLMMALVGVMILAFFGNFAFLLATGGEPREEPEQPPAAAVAAERPESESAGEAGAGGAEGSGEASEGDETSDSAAEEMRGVGAPTVEPAEDIEGTAAEETAEVDKPPPPATSLDFVAVLGLIGTTFSVAGAFYQSYLVREKGWGLKEAKEGLIDSVAGIAVLGSITLVIMLTSAISFYGRDVQLNSAADVARQLDPLFGPYAVILFSVGIFAGSFSSFLVNAMIGGAMLADGLGLGGKMDSMATKGFTTAALLVGMLVAMFVPSADRVGLVVFAQAMVVIGFPLLAASMLYMATRPELSGERRIPRPLIAIAVLGLLVVLLSAGRLAWTLVERLL